VLEGKTKQILHLRERDNLSTRLGGAGKRGSQKKRKPRKGEKMHFLEGLVSLKCFAKDNVETHLEVGWVLI